MIIISIHTHTQGAGARCVPTSGLHAPLEDLFLYWCNERGHGPRTAFSPTRAPRHKQSESRIFTTCQIGR